MKEIISMALSLRKLFLSSSINLIGIEESLKYSGIIGAIAFYFKPPLSRLVPFLSFFGTGGIMAKKRRGRG